LRAGVAPSNFANYCREIEEKFAGQLAHLLKAAVGQMTLCLGGGALPLRLLGPAARRCVGWPRAAA